MPIISKASTISKLQELLQSSILYINTYIGRHEVKDSDVIEFWRIAMSERPGDPSGEQLFPEDCISLNIWGDPRSSRKELDNSKYTCDCTAVVMATSYTLQGYEVFLNGKLFHPEQSPE